MASARAATRCSMPRKLAGSLESVDHVGHHGAIHAEPLRERDLAVRMQLGCGQVAAEVDVNTFGQPNIAELATSGVVHTLPSVVGAWTRLPTA